MESTQRRIVVGYDGSPDADLALTWAAHMAQRRRSALLTVIVATDMDPLVGDYHQRGEHLAEEWRDRAAKLLMELPGGPGDLGDLVIRHGPAVPELLAAAHDEQMLVVGSHGHGLMIGSLTGSVSQHLARHATCPVVVVRRPHLPDATRIVVGLDGSPESDRALRFACEVADRQPVVAVHGYHAVTPATGSTDEVFASETAHRIENAERLLRDWVADAQREHPEVSLRTEPIPMAPVRALVDSSWAASLLVVGSRGRDAFADLLLGSVSQHVLRDAHCPVAVVR
jgi:nucleotide-binding universal stress UspA family protein